MKLLFDKWGVYCCILLFISTQLQAQDAFYCEKPEDRKLARQAEEVIDSTKTLDYRLNSAISLVREDKNSIWALHHKTELQYWRNWSMGKSIEVLEDEFKQVVDNCPGDFPMAYYYLGNITYLLGNPEGAKKYYQEFIKASRDFDNIPLVRLQEAKESIKVLDFKKEIDAAAYDLSPYTLQGPNTTDQEYLPAISPDNAQLYFTRKYQEQLLGEFKTREVEKIMVSDRNEGSNTFSAAVNLEHPFNQGEGNYGGLSISLTGKEIFLTICIRDASGYANCDIYRALKKVSAIEDGKVYYYWEELEKLPETINGKDSWESQPSISGDGRTMLFAKYSDNTRGIDIYQSTRDSSGTWSKASPLPGGVNSPGNDKAPFFHPDGKTLYFSSDGHRGLGGYDLFISNLEDGLWQAPKNLGKPINSGQDEHGLIVSTDGKYAYFSSTEYSSRADFDLLSFELPADIRPEEVVVYKGYVDNPTDGASLELTRADGSKLKDIEVASGDGLFATILKKEDVQEPVLATVKKKGYAFSSEVVSASNAKEGVIKGEKLGLREIVTDEPYRINDINFASNSYVLTKEAKVVLKQFAAFLNLNSSYLVEIRGHTDNVGGAESNRKLSLNRALAVREYLLTCGVTAKRLSHKGFGQDMPLASNDSEVGRSKNRRTEFVLLKP